SRLVQLRARLLELCDLSPHGLDVGRAILHQPRDGGVELIQFVLPRLQLRPGRLENVVDALRLLVRDPELRPALRGFPPDVPRIMVVGRGRCAALRGWIRLLRAGLRAGYASGRCGNGAEEHAPDEPRERPCHKVRFLRLVTNTVTITTCRKSVFT